MTGPRFTARSLSATPVGLFIFFIHICTLFTHLALLLIRVFVSEDAKLMSGFWGLGCQHATLLLLSQQWHGQPHREKPRIPPIAINKASNATG